ncbi:winged helix-turn-helix transcriptional regulator [Flexibacterium corallicola]|uniref:winged helix-turn-helix transcriptional regulator n=1 Tax=Flexibacterium corallicola TaxID=3037259 RepID=UPI00286F3D2E|nr:helix-turn-helix domain-containing protein [Pseudovibrio sp. M1P-2-3]
MSRSNLSESYCSIARTIATVGDEWSLMIIREMFLGGPRRFDHFQKHLDASTNTISQRLKKLEVDGIISRTVYRERPVRHEYWLTEKGLGLWPVFVTMKNWGDQWLMEGPPLFEIEHKECGHLTVPQLYCSHCSKPMTAKDAKAKLNTQVLTSKS